MMLSSFHVPCSSSLSSPCSSVPSERISLKRPYPFPSQQHQISVPSSPKKKFVITQSHNSTLSICRLCLGGQGGHLSHVQNLAHGGGDI